MENLRITLIQTDIIWEKPMENQKRYETNYLTKLQLNETDLILFPELFTTGFTMDTANFFETMTGPTLLWMQHWAKKLNTQLGGSLIIKENENYYNRFVMVSEHGVETFYDKSHLFRMGYENNHFTKGNQRVIHTIKGWNLLLQVCYDLRFPVFSRNQTLQNKKEYDAILYIANWPAVRSEIWSTLLKARAIENQSFCIGVNRVGKNVSKQPHSGQSLCITPWGTETLTMENHQSMTTIELDNGILKEITSKFPAFLDSDHFKLTD